MARNTDQQALPFPQTPRRLDVAALESWLWEAACVIRGPLDAPKFKDYILPLIFLKRLSDVFDDELLSLAHQFGDPASAARLAAQDHGLVRVYLPPEARWPALATQTTSVGQFLTDAVRAVARENPKLAFLKDVQDFNATASGQRILDEERLKRLIGVLNDPAYRLGLDDVEPDILGRAYEYLLRKFAENQGQSAGEFYTPPEVAIVMARIPDPKPGETVYDPRCGSGPGGRPCSPAHGLVTGRRRREDQSATPLSGDTFVRSFVRSQQHVSGSSLCRRRASSRFLAALFGLGALLVP